MKDFLSHVDAITHYSEELLEACEPGMDDPTFDDDVLVYGGMLGKISHGHLRRLRAALDAYHVRYGKAEAAVVLRLREVTDGRTHAKNQELMDAVLKVILEQKAEPVLAAGVLVDAAATLMATQQRLRHPTDLRLTCDEFRKRLKSAIRAHQDLLDERATKSPILVPGPV